MTDPLDAYTRTTGDTRHVLSLSLREALQLGHNYIGTEHLLLGLLKENTGLAAQALALLGVELHAARKAVIEVVAKASSKDEIRRKIADLQKQLDE